MIENKRQIFAHGVRIFAVVVCGRDEETYFRSMASGKGYSWAAKKFFEMSPGYLPKEEVDDLYGKDIIPEWMIEVYEQVEQEIFG